MTITLKGPSSILDISIPRIMGIVNVTPDSFYKKSRYNSISEIVDKVGEMIIDGAEIIDVGAVSTRPGSEAPTVNEEIKRIYEPLKAIRSAFPDLLISVDTFRTEVLIVAMDAEINLVNDISGGRIDENFLGEIAKAGLPYIMMHMQGKPDSMQENPEYKDVILTLLKYFDKQIAFAKSFGIKEMIVDPGFGFGKSIKDNYEILKHLNSFRIFDLPILVGLSRKSMVCEPLDIGPEGALNGTTALHMIALLNGARILRVHDVKQANQCIKLFNLYSN